jgi:glycerate-2-kinase
MCALLLQNHPGITVLSAGTDGADGSTNAAGAVVDSDTVATAISLNIDPQKYLSDFDSFHFFRKAGGHIITGPTMTNVMDIIVVIVE